MEKYITKLVEDNLQKIVNQVKQPGSPVGKGPDIKQFFPNIELNKLNFLTKRICQEKAISLQDLYIHSKKYIQQNNKLLTEMTEQDLIEITVSLLKEKEQTYSPFTVYAKNYLSVIDKNKPLSPQEIYTKTNDFDREITEINLRKQRINREDKHRKLHKKLANLEIEVKSKFTSLEELKKSKAIAENFFS